MKSLLTILSLVTITILVSCGGDSEEGMKDKCADSDLDITITNTTDATCDSDGQFVASGSGGAGGFTYSIDGTSFQSGGTFDLSAGNYTVTVKDADECTSSISTTIGAGENSVLISNVSVTADSGCGTSLGSIEVTASGGDESYMYNVDGGSFQSSSVFSGLGQGTHSVIVKDSEGCEDDDIFAILTGTALMTDIVPIINATCAVALIMGTAVIEKASRILDRAVVEGSMPPAGNAPLSETQKNLIACWVNDGALNN